MSNLSEGLRKHDLKDLMYPVFEVDTFKSKMGEDPDVCVLTFRAKDRYPAKDFMEFVEKNYSFVLDADVSSGENQEGEYSIFVEIARTPEISTQIESLLNGAERLTGINEWGFRYYKDTKAIKATTESLKSKIPTSKEMYESVVQKVKTENVKSFFTKTLMDDFVLEGNKIIIKKPFGVSVQLELVSEGDQTIAEGISPTVDEEATAEIFWLTKVLGDYNISKYGDSFLFTNEDKAMLLKRRV